VLKCGQIIQIKKRKGRKMKFNDRLRELRKGNGLTQDEFSKQSGLTRSAISMYERGEREPNFETLEKLADFFNVDMNYLLGKSDNRCRDVVSYLRSGAAGALYFSHMPRK
jgi:transcriptional regulator with XRE-family HTH domain